MSNPSMEELFSALLSEAKSFTGAGRGRPRKEGTPQTRSGGKVTSPEAISALSAIDAALAKRKADLIALRSRDKEELLHRNAFYTVNEIPGKVQSEK